MHKTTKSFISVIAIATWAFSAAIPNARGATAPPVAQLFRAAPGAHEGQGIAIMANGNIVATGQFQGTATFGATTLTSGGSFDYFLAVYNPQGQAIWAKGAGSTAADFGAKVIVDAAGNIVVAGVFQGPVNFHGTTLNGFGAHDFFVAKYSPAGDLLWVRVAGGTEADQAVNIAEDGAGNYLVSGRIRGPAAFSDAVTIGQAGQTWCVLAKYDGSGNLAWARQVVETDTTAGSGVAADANGNSFITGLSKTDGAGPFLAKYDSAGTREWIWIAGTGLTFFEEGSSVDLDGAGNIYVAGRFSASSLTLGSTTLSNPNGSAKGFIAKFDPTGAPVWGVKAGARGFALDAQPDGTVYATGFFSTGSPEIGNVTASASAGMLHLYMAKISTAGELLWAKPSENWQSGIGRAITRHGSSIFAIGEGGAELYDVGTFPGGVFIVELREAASRPSLSATLVGDLLRLSWPAEFAGFAIQTATDVAGQFGTPTVQFTPVAGQPNTFTTPRPASNLFFRLAQP